ncbi:MAG: hypothetical protein RLZZ436_3765 [Planctomycetota bacterium]
MLAILLSVLCFQADSAAKPTADADQLLQSITDQLQLEVRTAEEAHAQRREMLFTAFAADLQQLQKDLTRTMKFDEALQVRSLAERFSKLESLPAKRAFLSEPQPDAPDIVLSLIQRATGDYMDIDTSLATALAAPAEVCVGRLQELLTARSAEGDLDSCLKIRDRLSEIRRNYLPEVAPREELPRTEDGVKEQQAKIEAESQARIIERLNVLGESLSKTRGSSSQERSLVRSLIQQVTRERDVSEKVRILRRNVARLSAARNAVEQALEAIDTELQVTKSQLEKLDNQLKFLRNETLLAAVAEWRIDAAIGSYQKLQSADPANHPIRLDPETGLDLPEPSAECARIMDRFEESRIFEERHFQNQIRPGLEELRRRLAVALAAAPSGDRRSRDAIAHCQAWLDSPAADTLEGLRLVPSFLEVPAEVELGTFAAAVESLLDERHKSRRKSLETLQLRLKPVLEQIVQEADIHACISTLVHVRWLGRRFDPYPVMMSRVPWEAASTSATVIDVAGRAALVRHSDLKRGVWHSRRLLRTTGEPPLITEPSAGNDDWRQAARFLPGPAIVRVNDIPTGTRVFVLQGSSWELATISARTVSDATIEWPRTPQRSPEKVDWRKLYQLQF